MADYVDFVIRSSEKVLEHCEALLQKPLAPQERARIHARREAESKFIALLRTASWQQAA